LKNSERLEKKGVETDIYNTIMWIDQNLIMQLPNCCYDIILHHNIVEYENDV